MNPLFQQIVIATVNKAQDKKGALGEKVLSDYAFAKELYKIKVNAIHLIKDALLITVGVIAAGFGLESFLLPNLFIDGGVTGISLLTAEITKQSLPLLIVLINIPFIILGFTQIGKTFAIKSVIAIVGLALAITFIHYPIVTSDKLLVSVFGGFFVGAGIGFTMRGGGVLDGTEVLAIYFAKRLGLTIGDFILILNIVIFSFAAYLLSIETAMYSILAYMAASKTVDFVIVGFEEYTGVTIISSHSEEIRLMITNSLGRGVTVYSGKRGYGKRGATPNNIDIIYTVITRLEIGKLQTEVEKIDPNAFIVMNAIKETKGGMIKKKTIHT